MKLRTFGTAAEFLDVAGPTLFADEAESSLLLGVALRVLMAKPTAKSRLSSLASRKTTTSL
jgi:hypothetical protein